MDLIPKKRPMREISSLRRDMDSLWNRFFDETPFFGSTTEEWFPSVDISETKDKVIVKAELPGLSTDDLNVNLSDDILTIKGEKKEEDEEKGEHHHYIERYCGSFQRSIKLPAHVKTNKVKANFKKGVLIISMPKTEESKKKIIDIKVE